MSPARHVLGPSLLLLLALGGCAARSALAVPAPGGPATTGGDVAAPEPPLAGAALPPPVEENATFVTIDGVAWYRIGAGDVLDVLLTKDVAQDRLTAEVKPSGQVTLGFFTVPVAGLTTEQAAAEIHRVLAPTHRALTVEVTVREYRSKAVSVLGEVERGVHVPLRGRTTVAELLAGAGGTTIHADLRAVRLLRRDGRAYTLDLLRSVREGGPAHAVVVDAGDVIFVPSKRPEEEKVYLLGEVQAPGAYPFVPRMRLSHALALAGGTKETALLGGARIIRGDLRQAQVVEVDVRRALSGQDPAQDLVLERNDLIVVPRTAIGNWNAFLAKIRPTLDALTLPLQPVAQYLLLRELLDD